MTFGSTDSTEKSTATGNSQTGLSVSAVVSSQPGVYGTRTVYQVPALTTSQPVQGDGMSEPVAKKRKIEATTALTTTAAAAAQKEQQQKIEAEKIRAMQAYQYSQTLLVNQLLLTQIAMKTLTAKPSVEPKASPTLQKTAHKQAEPKQVPSKKRGEMLDSTKNALKAHLQARSNPASAHTASAVSQELVKAKIKDSVFEKLSGVQLHNLSSGEQKLVDTINALFEDCSEEISQFCGVHIAPDRFFQLIRHTAEALLGLNKGKRLNEPNQLLAPKLKARMSARQRTYCYDIVRNTRSKLLKLRTKENEVFLSKLGSTARLLKAPPEDRGNGLDDVFRYYLTALSKAGLKITFSELRRLVRAAKEPPQVRSWLRQKLKASDLTQKHFDKLEMLILLAQRHSVYFDYYHPKPQSPIVVKEVPVEKQASDSVVKRAELSSQPVIASGDKVTESAEQKHSSFVTDVVEEQTTEPENSIEESESLSTEPDRQAVPLVENIAISAEGGSVEAASIEGADDSIEDVVVPSETVEQAAVSDKVLSKAEKIILEKRFPGMTNPGNACYIISVLQYLRATIPEVEQREMVSGWRTIEEGKSLALPATIKEALAALFAAMDNCMRLPEGKRINKAAKQKIDQAFRAFVHTCLPDTPVALELPCIPVRNKSGSFGFPKLIQNDAHGLLMVLEDTLALPDRRHLDVYEQLVLKIDDKQYCKPMSLNQTTDIIATTLESGGSVQKSLDNFFEEEIVTCHWDKSEVPEEEASGFVEGDYQTRKHTALKADLSAFHRLMLCLKTNNGSDQINAFVEKDLHACERAIDTVFKPVYLSVTDSKTEKAKKLRLKPTFVVAHQGADYHSGHYIVLQQSEHGWVVNDDQRPAFVAYHPERFLRSKKFHPYLIHYEVVNDVESTSSDGKT